MSYREVHPDKSVVASTALASQVAGDHYKQFAIQPVEFVHVNGIGYVEGSAIKYLCRHRLKGGGADIRKAIHFCELLLELEYPEQDKGDTMTVPRDTPGAREAEAAVNNQRPDTVTFASGATRSADAAGLRYDLVSPIGLRRLAARHHLGCGRYGNRNWEKGFPASDTFNHLVAHLYEWIGGDRSEDHLAAAAWGCFALMHYEEKNPTVLDVPGGKREA